MAKRKRHTGGKPVRFFKDVLGRKSYYRLYNSNGDLLCYVAKPLLQKLSRDVLNALVYRWKHNLGCNKLTRYNVRVRDNQAYLPQEGCSGDREDYPKIFLEFLQDVFDPVANVHDSDINEYPSVTRAWEDLCNKLSDPELSLVKFRNLFFHLFFQTEEELCDFPAVAVWNLRNIKFYHEGLKENWTDAYTRWDALHPREGAINLIRTCRENDYFMRAYKHKHKHKQYANNAVKEAELVRNGITHFNENVMKDVPPPDDFFNKRQIGEVVLDLFPDVSFRLFDFMWDNDVNMDFTMSRTCFSE